MSSIEIRDASDNFLVGFHEAKQAAHFLRWIERQYGDLDAVRVVSYDSNGEPVTVVPREGYDA